MVESKLSFLEMQIEGTLGQAIELGHPSLCIAPETFDPIDVSFTGGELTGAMVNTEMLVKYDLHQPIVTRPAIRMDNRNQVDVSPDNLLQCGLHNFRVENSLTLKEPEENRLHLGSSSAATTKSLNTKVRLIHFNRTVQRRSLFTGFSQSLTNLK